ncbi:MAG TPA: molybdopterin molybdenumtransferase MoeA, partial [Saprospiraceae bacterium]|nr:molybdopterin molybdenumtransferase MoeA [Saprospiraceae bacterium]
MISASEAFQIVLQHAASFGDEHIPLDRALGRILREPLCADRDFPPFDRVTMDGIAIDFQAFAQGQRQFPIRGIQAAGAPPIHLADPNSALEVMTGAMLPTGANTVIRYEDVEIKDSVAHILTEDVKAGQNIHRQGHDRRAGDVIVPAGRRISPAEIGVAATVGKASLLAARLPKIAILYTGDELVDVETTPLP